MSAESQQQEWVKNGWSTATKLLSILNPEILPCVSKTPTMVFEDKFILFYAVDPTNNPKKEFWIITGGFPPAAINASNTNDEREALHLLGELYIRDGIKIKCGDTSDLSLPEFVLGEKKNDPTLGEFLERMGGYLKEMSCSFPWDKYGINGKVFSVGKPKPGHGP